MSNAKLRDVLESFRAVEWHRVDWQGFCAFRRSLGCPGMYGHNDAFGKLQRTPHAEHCPYSALNSLGDELEGRE